MTKLLYPLFPRQISLPFRKTVDRKEFYDTINRYNGHKRIFSSIYNYTGNFEYDRLALVVDKVFFDFDGAESIQHALALIEECVSNDYEFVPFFSGAGIHIYVFTTKDRLLNPKMAVGKFQNKFTGMDRSSVGDIARVATIPNTFNTKRGRFCIPVSIDEIRSGFEYMRELALLQRWHVFKYGSTKIDLKPFDGPAEDTPVVFDEPRIEVKQLESLPPCINDILSYAKKGFRGRYLIITYLKDAGYLESQIEDIITEFCTEDESKHCIKEERQVKYLYWSNIMFPACEQIKNEGRCCCEGFCNYTRSYGKRHLVKIYK